MHDAAGRVHLCSYARGGLAGKKVWFHIIHTPTLKFTYCTLFRPKWMHQLNSFRVESSWKLGQWEELETYLKLVSGCVCVLCQLCNCVL